MAPGVNVNIESDLRKLTKQDLINYIVLRRMPDSTVCLGEARLNFLKGRAEDTDHLNRTVVGENDECMETSCILVRCDLRVARVEVESHKRLTSELGTQIEQLNTIISLMKSNHKSEVNRSIEPRKQNNNGPTTSTRLGSSDRAAKRSANSREAAAPTSGVPVLQQQGTTSTSSLSCEKLNASNNRVPTGQVVTRQQLASAISEAESRSIMGVPVNPPEREETNWRTVTNKRRRHHKAITGTGTNCTIKAVPSLTYYHIYRLDPACTETDIKNYLISLIPEVTCEKLQSRRADEYSSFKIGVNDSHSENITDPTLWPPGTKISKFFHLRKIPKTIG